jgi:hypothetical protein
MTNILFWANEAFPCFLLPYIRLHSGWRYRDESIPIGLEYIRRP